MGEDKYRITEMDGEEDGWYVVKLDTTFLKFIDIPAENTEQAVLESAKKLVDEHGQLDVVYIQWKHVVESMEYYEKAVERLKDISMMRDE